MEASYDAGASKMRSFARGMLTCALALIMTSGLWPCFSLPAYAQDGVSVLDASSDVVEAAGDSDSEEDHYLLPGQGVVWQEDAWVSWRVSLGANLVGLSRESDGTGAVRWQCTARHDIADFGTAVIEVTYRKTDGSTATRAINIHVVESIYLIEPDLEKMGLGQGKPLLPGDTTDVWLQGERRTAVRHERSDGSIYYAYETSADGLEYRWSLSEGSGLATLITDDADPAHVTIAANGVQASQSHVNGSVAVTFDLYDRGRKVEPFVNFNNDKTWTYWISDNFYTVVPTTVDNPDLFCSTTIDVKMVHRYLDGDGRSVTEDLSNDRGTFRWKYSGDSLRITDAAGNEVANDGVTPAGAGPYTITRLNEQTVFFYLTAQGYDAAWGYDPTATCSYALVSKGYALDFECSSYLVGEGYSAPVRLDLSGVAGIPEDARDIRVSVGNNWNSETSSFKCTMPESAYNVEKASDSWTITIPYESLRDFRDRYHYGSVNVHAELIVGDGTVRREAFTYVQMVDGGYTRFFVDADPADTNNHGAEVEWMARSGISEGWVTADGRREFRGMENVTRCDFAAFLYRLADLSDDGARNDSIKLSDAQVAATLATVSDCDARTPHAAEVAWLVNTGISRGWADKGGKTVSFRPMAKVARQDMAAFLYRFADLQDNQKQDRSLKKGAEQVTFKDVRPGDEANHASEVEWLASVGVTKGWKVGSKYEFRGTRTVARQDMAAFMYRLNGYLRG